MSLGTRAWAPAPHRSRSAHLDVMLADGFKDGQKMGDAKQVTDRLAHVGDFQHATGRLGVDIETNQSAESGAIHVCEVEEVEHDVFGAGDELANLDVKMVVQTRHQAACAAHYGGFPVAVNGEGEAVCWGLVGHLGRNLPLTVWDLCRAIVTHRGAERKRFSGRDTLWVGLFEVKACSPARSLRNKELFVKYFGIKKLDGYLLLHFAIWSWLWPRGSTDVDSSRIGGSSRTRLAIAFTRSLKLRVSREVVA